MSSGERGRDTVGIANAGHFGGAGSLLAAVGQLIGIELRSDVDVLRLQREGVPMDAFERLAQHLPAVGIEVIASRSSIRRRKGQGFLSMNESERALRIARVLARATELFGSETLAQEWLARPVDYVPGEDSISPLELCAHDAGAELIENSLLRTRYGML